ncbi:MAG: hypothetical protein RL011_2303 [Pseudomonadota bacterium]
MRTLPAITLIIAGLVQACVDPAPAPPPASGSRTAGAKSGEDDATEAASPHAGDIKSQKVSPSPGGLSNPTQVIAAVPPPPAPWTPTTQTSPQPVAGAQSPSPDNLSSVLSSLVGIGTGALGGASLGGFLGDLIGNQELGTLLGSVAGATLGGGLAQSSQGTIK